MGKTTVKHKKKRKPHKQNRQYKDSVFVVLLYNALSGKELAENARVENLNLKRLSC